MQKELKFPCMKPELVPLCKVVCNGYNPNNVAKPEMDLLALSIAEDGVTMPVVVYHDIENDKYIVVDGEHRYTILRDVFHSNVIPVSIIDKNIDERIASTIRHNRARGVHKIMSMADIVARLVRGKWADEDIARHLGMSVEELLRLKQIKGIAQILANKEYGREWIIK